MSRIFTNEEIDALCKNFESRLIPVPKPGTEPFTPHPWGGLKFSAGGSPKAGDPAGFSSVGYPMNAGGLWGIVSGVNQVQEMIWAHDPFYQNAAQLIRSLQAERKSNPVLEAYERGEYREVGIGDKS
jgi:hypothetical protein